MSNRPTHKTKQIIVRTAPCENFTEQVNHHKAGRSKQVQHKLISSFLTLCLLCQYKVSTQKTQDIDSMLVQCWASVVDDGPTLNQHWVNVSCLLRSQFQTE